MYQYMVAMPQYKTSSVLSTERTLMIVVVAAEIAEGKNIFEKVRGEAYARESAENFDGKPKE